MRGEEQDPLKYPKDVLDSPYIRSGWWKMQTDQQKLDNIMRKRTHVYKSIKKLFAKVNINTPRNSLCNCGSGKKWKKCCIVKYDARCYAMEKLTQMYKNLTLKAIDLKKKVRVVSNT